MRYWQFAMILLMLTKCEMKREAQQKDEQLKLLILSGSNNHDWQKTTPVLAEIYELSNRFSTQVTEQADTLTIEDFHQFDAVISNYTAWPEHDFRWPSSAENGLMQYIDEGGGFVLFHAASAAFYDWEAYQQMVGTSWGDSTKHGKITPHKIVIKDKNHPITEGMSDFWITDELWVNSGVNSELNVLAESYSEPSNSGRGEFEPVVHWNTKGEGRIFHNILGHDVRAMKNTGWKTLMLRGTEWAATRKVTVPLPNSLGIDIQEPSAQYSWNESDTTLALMNGNNILWQYNFNTQKGKPFFHPLNIGNSTITALSPDDHPWHLGLWHSWKFINGVNYWEYDRENNVTPWNFLGVTEIRNIEFEKGADFSCKIMLQIAYHEIGGQDLILEDRNIIVSAPDEGGLYFIDYEFDLVGVADEAELNRTPLPHEENGKNHGGYAGLSLRFNQDFYQSTYINADGSTDKGHGKPMAWKYFGLKDIKGNRVGTAIFDHPQNLSYPTAWFMSDDVGHPFYYFSPAPIFHKPHVLKKGDELKLMYRLKLYAGEVNAEKLGKDQKDFLSNAKVE